jgi:hypothetical protein
VEKVFSPQKRLGERHAPDTATQMKTFSNGSNPCKNSIVKNVKLHSDRGPQISWKTDQLHIYANST